MRKRRPPKPEAAIASAATLASFIGLCPATYAGLLYTLKQVAAGRLSEGNHLYTFGAMWVGVLSGTLAVYITEVGVAMRQVRVTRGVVARGIVLGDAVVGLGALTVWFAVGFRGWMMSLPVFGVWLGAWLSARHVWPFGKPRVPTPDAEAVSPE